MSPLARHQVLVRVLFTVPLALAVVAVALSLPTSGEHRTLTPRQENELIKADRGQPHVHNPTFKNDIARGGEVVKEARDATTARQARSAAAYVAAERRRPDPTLTRAPAPRTRVFHPRNRYEMAGGCYTMRTTPSHYIRRVHGGVTVRKMLRGEASRFTFQATDLGRYLLYGRGKVFLAGSDGVAVDKTPSRDAAWTVRKVGSRYTFTLPGKRGLTVRKGRLALAKRARPFTLEKVVPCIGFPESAINITGRPHAGITPFQEVRGFVDAHTHGMAFEFLGGNVHCGKPWDRYGVTYALRDCPDHIATGGVSLLGAALEGTPKHDPVGWPTFKDWPAPESLEHEGTYYRWMERAWRGGQRLFVNLLVENNQLCQVYPGGKNSCDDMDSIRLQAKDMYKFQDYIDAQFGGPGKGFYRIVKTPFEARKVINAGKMAVVMGIETSRPFGCTFKHLPTGDVPACSRASIDRQLNEVHKLGVRQMELTNKFDNALTGVAGDQGTTGVIVNGANFLETGTFWNFKHCEPADGESSDREQLAFPEISAEQQDALFGAIGQVFGGLLPAVPLYPPPPQCNARGLTSLGEHTLRGLAKRHMIFDPDHMSVKGRNSALDVVDRIDYPGVVSSHSWSTADAYPRIYHEGGFITPYAGDSTGFVDKWRRHVGWADKHYYWGIGFGADINGLGAQGDPRGATVPNKVTYPFRGLGGVVIKKQHAGKRVYDINRDGVAQYGLYPDWIEDLTKVAGRKDGKAIFNDMSRGPEAYLQMWERAVGISADSCRNPGLRKNLASFRRLVKPGMGNIEVLRRVGQPFSRLGSTYGFCAKQGGKNVLVNVDLTGAGKVGALRAIR